MKRPVLADALPRTVLVDLYRQVAPLEAHLRAALAASDPAPRQPAEPVEDWITLEEAAVICGRPRNWLLRRQPRPAWIKRLGRKTFVVSRPGLRRWLDSRPS